MQELLSVWLVLQKQDEQNLGKIVKDLALKNNSPVFTPHLTLIGDIMINFEDLKSAVDEVFAKEKPFKIKPVKINQSELFFKTVFIELELSKDLERIFLNLAEKTDKRSIDTFKPHISLMYKIMPQKEKLEIIKKLEIKDEFTIGSVYINAPKIGDADFMDVEGWRNVYKKVLNH